MENELVDTEEEETVSLLSKLKGLSRLHKAIFAAMPLVLVGAVVILWEDLSFAFIHWRYSLMLAVLLAGYIFKQLPKYEHLDLEDQIFEYVCHQPSTHGELLDHFGEESARSLGPLLTRMLESERLALINKRYHAKESP